jgi:hypothetical protein
MEAGPNGLDLQILSKQSQIYIFFKFRKKIRKLLGTTSTPTLTALDTWVFWRGLSGVG